MLTQTFKTAFAKQAEKLGASASKFIAVKDIPLGHWTRLKCQYGCGSYGKNLCCPPYTPDADTMEKLLQEYKGACLVQYTCSLTDPEDWSEIDRKMSQDLLAILLALEKMAFTQNYYKAFALKAGNCYLCPECTLTTCRFPHKARPSMEACGIDVFALVRQAGFKIKVLPEHTHELQVYGLILLE